MICRILLLILIVVCHGVVLAPLCFGLVVIGTLALLTSIGSLWHLSCIGTAPDPLCWSAGVLSQLFVNW